MEKKEREYADNLPIEVISVKVNANNPKNEEEVQKVIFETTKGSISFKPKVDTVSMRNGLEVHKQELCMINDLPAIITDIAKIVTTKGKCKLHATYQIWNTQTDGEEVTYRYVQNKLMMLKWTIDEEQEEKV